jgi:HD-GYP domain-containing protein (c-di-GMP phosphodiesterase class II)
MNSKLNKNEFTSTWSLYQLNHDLNSSNANAQAMLSSEIAARSILQALDARDHYTYGHSIRVAHYSLILGQYLEFDTLKLYELELSALFHDIGKITVPLNILCKPSGLTNDEFKIMKKHPEMSYEILSAFKGFQQIAKNAKYHHEHFNGKGYPDKIAGDTIPLCSRIILIADTYDAITSSRIYREGMNAEVAFEELIQFSGTQFDPKLASTFVEAMRHFQRSQKQDNVIPLFPAAVQKKAA